MGFKGDPLRLPLEAEAFMARIEKQIKVAEAELEDHEALEVRVPYPGVEPMQATWFGFHGPDMLLVHGVDRQARDIRLLIHVSSAQILLTIVPKETQPERPTVGFQSSP